MCRNMVDIQSVTAEIRQRIKKIEDRRKKPQGKNIMSTFAMQGGHNHGRLSDTVIQLRSIYRHTDMKRTENHWRHAEQCGQLTAGR